MYSVPAQPQRRYCISGTEKFKYLWSNLKFNIKLSSGMETFQKLHGGHSSFIDSERPLLSSGWAREATLLPWCPCSVWLMGPWRRKGTCWHSRYQQAYTKDLAA